MTLRQFKFYLQANWIKTLYINFKLLPLKRAIKFPILIYGKCYTQISNDAVVEFKDGGGFFASVIIGNTSSGLFGNNIRPNSTILVWEGVITFSGKKQFIGNGCCITISKGAHLYLGDHIFLNNNVKICCQHSIHIDDWTDVSWDSQFFDTNFHYLVDKDGLVSQKLGSIYIGKNCWIGNRVTIQKGTYLNNNSVVASNSLVNKDFSGINNGLFAGIPAKAHSNGKFRLRNYALEYKLNEYFSKYANRTMAKVDLGAVQHFYDLNNLDIKHIK